jgi:hypothetical protein
MKANKQSKQSKQTSKVEALAYIKTKGYIAYWAKQKQGSSYVS